MGLAAKKLNPLWWFKNDDEPKAPSWYRPEWPNWRRQLYWYCRNPLHNFTFYVIGIADKVDSGEAVREGRYPKDVFNPNGGWNLCWFEGIFSMSVYICFFIFIMANILLFQGINGKVIMLASLIIMFYLPFISYTNKSRSVKLYIGWRNRGNLGAKINL